MGLFNLSIDPGNIINLFVLLGPLFISTFFILYSCFQGTLAGIYWLIGVLFSQWCLGLLVVRTTYAYAAQKSTNKTFRKLIKEGKTTKQAYNEMRMKANKNNFSSYIFYITIIICYVFSFYHHFIIIY